MYTLKRKIEDREFYQEKPGLEIITQIQFLEIKQMILSILRTIPTTRVTKSVNPHIRPKRREDQ